MEGKAPPKSTEKTATTPPASAITPEGFISQVTTTLLAVVLAVGYHMLYTVVTKPGLSDRLASLNVIEQFHLLKETTDVHFDLLLAAVTLALGSHAKVFGVRAIVMISVTLMFASVVGAWLEVALKHNPDHAFTDGAALASYWGPNIAAVIMFLITALVVSSRKES